MEDPETGERRMGSRGLGPREQSGSVTQKHPCRRWNSDALPQISACKVSGDRSECLSVILGFNSSSNHHTGRYLAAGTAAAFPLGWQPLAVVTHTPLPLTRVKIGRICAGGSRNGGGEGKK